METDQNEDRAGDKQKMRKKWRQKIRKRWIQTNNGDKKERGKLELTPLP